jgi:cell division protein FtsQ
LFALSQGDWTGWVASGVRSLRVLLLSDRFNPPRFVRRTRRLANRLLTGEVKLPRFAATMTTALLLCGFGGYGIIAGGYLPAVFASVSSSAGFAIDHVAVSGQRETSEIDVLGQIELDGSTSMFGFDVDAARRRIIELPWVKDAAVTKIYPDTVRVKLTERKAYAIWQRDDELTLIDSSGIPIVAFREARYAGLPLVVGAGAATKAEDFVTLVQSHPDLAGKVKGYIRVSDRRWDLRLESGITIKLPEIDPSGALDELTQLDDKYGLLSRDIEAVDLRDDERLVLELSPEAATQRKAAIKLRMERGKKGKSA